MAQGFWTWLKTAASNALSDSSINWAEGQSPASVNDSFRGMMTRLAEWRDDISGALYDTGTATAYAVATNEGLAATPNNGQMVSFVPANTNGATPTLACDGGTAFPIWQALSTPVAAGTLVAGSPYTVSFNTANSAWLLKDFVAFPALSALTIPLGGYIDYDGLAPPSSNLILPYGQAISRTTYASYFALVGTTFGSGDGSTTFNVRDMRGRAFF